MIKNFNANYERIVLNGLTVYNGTTNNGVMPGYESWEYDNKGYEGWINSVVIPNFSQSIFENCVGQEIKLICKDKKPHFGYILTISDIKISSPNITLYFDNCIILNNENEWF